MSDEPASLCHIPSRDRSLVIFDRILKRGAWTRTNRDITVNEPDGYMSDDAVHWIGLDSGGGAYPVGPNGPWGTSSGGLAVVQRATQLVVDPISSVPWRVTTDGTLESSTIPRWLADPMLLRPDARFVGSAYPAAVRLNRSKFWSDWLRSALWLGIGAFIFIEDADGQPLAGSLRLLNPGALQTDRDDGGALVWQIGDPSSWDSTITADREGRFTLGGVLWRVVVLRNPASPVTADGRSMGVFEMSPVTFGIEAQIESYMSGTFRSGVPAGYLKTTAPGMTQTQADELKSKWLAAHGGDQRSIAVLNATTDFTPISISPVDAAIAEQKRLAIADVAFAFGIDPQMLGVTLGNSATYSNVETHFQAHAALSLRGWIAAAQEVISSLLPGTSTMTIDFAELQAGTTQARYQTHAIALDAGWMTVDEVREREGLGPMPEEEKAAVPEQLAPFTEGVEPVDDEPTDEGDETP